MEQGLIPAWKKGYMSALLSPHVGNAQITPPEETLPQTGNPVSRSGTLCNQEGPLSVPKWEPHGTTHPKNGVALIPGDTY